MKATQCQQVYTALRNHCNGGTAQEIAAAANMPIKVAKKTLPTLKARDHIREGQPRKCNVTGNIAKCWYVL